MNNIIIENQILSPEENYCRVDHNQIKFISNRQTLSLVLGSCISTVFIGRNENYILAANHIVLANPKYNSFAASKSAEEQINEILHIFKKKYKIEKGSLRCFQLIGAGNSIPDPIIKVHIDNIKESEKILSKKGYNVIFNDTESYFVGMYSINKQYMSVFVENKFSSANISFTVNLEKLFNLKTSMNKILPASTLVPNNRGFEKLIKDKIVFDVTSAKQRNFRLILRK